MRTLAIALLTCAFALAADSPFVGTWTMNKAKSKLDPNGTQYDSLTVQFMQQGPSLTANITQNGTSFPGVLMDGKEYAIPGTPGAMGATHQVTTSKGRIIETQFKKDGKIVGTRKTSLSADGKLMTSVTDGTTLTGKKIHSVVVFDKQ